eukprot:3545404-Karenia_brevis.AAC.1
MRERKQTQMRKQERKPTQTRKQERKLTQVNNQEMSSHIGSQELICSNGHEKMMKTMAAVLMET